MVEGYLGHFLAASKRAAGASPADKLLEDAAAAVAWGERPKEVEHPKEEAAVTLTTARFLSKCTEAIIKSAFRATAAHWSRSQSYPAPPLLREQGVTLAGGGRAEQR
jgi:hypothetical protein